MVLLWKSVFSFQFSAADSDFQLKTGNWKLETGNWKLEMGRGLESKDSQSQQSEG
jgi:hypothetical protein